jgi:hypothetical protein
MLTRYITTTLKEESFVMETFDCFKELVFLWQFV